MAEKLVTIFLSASIPDPKRDPIYWGTADITAIRDSVKALATVVLPNAKLLWGGHPAITPLIRVVAESCGVSVKEHVVLYQSEFFRESFPPDNKAFEQVIFTPAGSDREKSLEIMREAMIRDNNFSAGIFIGGMEGVEREFELFREYHSSVPVYPIASTGAAARFIYEQYCSNLPAELSSELAYNSLFRRVLKNMESPSQLVADRQFLQHEAPEALHTIKRFPRSAVSTRSRLFTPSKDFAKIVGRKPLSRIEIIKRLWDYIKKNKLQDKKNRRKINADAALKRVFGGKAVVNMSEISRLVGKHLTQIERDVTGSKGDVFRSLHSKDDQQEIG